MDLFLKTSQLFTVDFITDHWPLQKCKAKFSRFR